MKKFIAGHLSYLVRPSDQSPGDFTLFFNAENVIHRFRITGCVSAEDNSTYFHIGGRNFRNISSIIERYINEDITDGYRLSPIRQLHQYIKPNREDYQTQGELLEENSDSQSEKSLKEKQNCFKKKSFSLSSPSQLSNGLNNALLNKKRNSIDRRNDNDTIVLSKNGYKNDELLHTIESDDYHVLSQSLNESVLKNSIYSAHDLKLNNLDSTIVKLNSSKSLSTPFNFNLDENSVKLLANQKPLAPEIINKKTDKIKLKGYLHKYNEKTKKWKPYWFSLNQTDQQLFYFSSEKKSKEKGLIDLTYGFYYPLDDSLLNRSHSFQIIIHSLGSSNANSHIVHYLSAENPREFKEWTESIRPLCNIAQHTPLLTRSLPSSAISSFSLSSSSSSSPLSGSFNAHTNLEATKLASNSPPTSTLNSNDSSKELFEQRQTTAMQLTSMNYHIVRTLSIDIHEARNICLHKNNSSNFNLSKYHKENMFYCLIMLNNDAFVASTKHVTSTSNSASSQFINSYTDSSVSPLYVKVTSRDSIWDDSFSFDNLPLDVKEVKVCLYAFNKSSNFSFVKKLGNYTNRLNDQSLLGHVNIRLDDLVNKGLHESWYNVEPTSQLQSSNEKFNCTIRIKIRFCEEKVYLNKGFYDSLSTYLSDPQEHKHICTIYEQILTPNERPHFIQALLKLSIAQNNLIEMLKSYLFTEISRCSDLATLFRPATVSTSLMDYYMRTRCEPFLHKAIEEPLAKILKVNFDANSFELDPNKCPDAQQREQNLINLQSALNEIIMSILNQTEIFPNELKYLFGKIREHVFSKWAKQQLDNKTGLNESSADDKLVRIYCVSAFAFLRLLCPSMLNPKNFGLKFFSNPKIDDTSKTSQKVNTNKMSYYDLCEQFAIFSPSFMLQANVNNNHASEHFISSVFSFQDKNPNNSTTTSTILPFIIHPNVSISNASNSFQMSIYEKNTKLLAKVLQTIANMTECKEPFMLPLSEFLNSHRANVVKFIDEISNVKELDAITIYSQEFFLTENDVNFYQQQQQFEHASCKYLAIISRLLISFLPQIKAIYLKKQSKLVDSGGETVEEEIDSLNSEETCDLEFSSSLERLVKILNEIIQRS